jgi:glycosyltransferase involved in cell wall biosynthesis
MKILWVKSDFLHPTDRGGQIRTLGMLKRLHLRHNIHYVALDLAGQPGGLERSSEYCQKAYPIPHWTPPKNTWAFWLQTGAGLFSPLPLVIQRYRSTGMRRQIEALLRTEKFDGVVCDFLVAAPNFPDLRNVVLFQHNVEALIWKRQAENAPTPVHKLFFNDQYHRMRRLEAQVCRQVRSVIAVSQADAESMRSLYGISRIAAVPTGVDLEYFAPPAQSPAVADLVFVGAMDWLPNIDGIKWFVDQILPLIRRRRPDCSLVIAGRRPMHGIEKLAGKDSRIRVTGTVPDVRPFLWGSRVSIVPLRSGSGTRLKIYEAMAAKIPIVSTSIGAEGLDIRNGEDIHIADSPAEFAERCLALLEDPAAGRRVADAAWCMVSSRYSWEVVSKKFEELLT